MYAAAERFLSQQGKNLGDDSRWNQNSDQVYLAANCSEYLKPIGAHAKETCP